MDKSRPNLFVLFFKDVGKFRLRGRRVLRSWTAPKTAKPGDIAFFYAGGEGKRHICAVGRTASKADRGIPDTQWTKSKQGYFADYEDLVHLGRPLSLYEIREAFPKWGRWKKLYGLRYYTVPEEYVEGLSGLVERENPNTRSLLGSSLKLAKSAQETDVDAADRSLVVVRRLSRDSRFGRLIRSRSSGKCAVCRINTDYEALGILEAAHIQPVQKLGPDSILNGLPLCPNHHALFDEGCWTVSGKKVLLSQNLPTAIRATFAREIKCAWIPGKKFTDWHRNHRFKSSQK
jgi:HNH endonuclease